jgi:hypothetical protein
MTTESNRLGHGPCPGCGGSDVIVQGYTDGVGRAHVNRCASCGRKWGLDVRKASWADGEPATITLPPGWWISYVRITPDGTDPEIRIDSWDVGYTCPRCTRKLEDEDGRICKACETEIAKKEKP